MLSRVTDFHGFMVLFCSLGGLSGFTRPLPLLKQIIPSPAWKRTISRAKRKLNKEKAKHESLDSFLGTRRDVGSLKWRLQPGTNSLLPRHDDGQQDTMTLTSAFDVFRDFFGIQNLPSPEDQAAALDKLIEATPRQVPLSKELQAALEVLVDYSAYFSKHRTSTLSRMAMYPGDAMYRHPPRPKGHYASHPFFDEEPSPVTPSILQPDHLTFRVIHARYGRFLTHPDVRTVVDLGAGSGSWSEFAAYSLSRNMDQPLEPADDPTKRLRIPESDPLPLKEFLARKAIWENKPHLLEIFDLKEFVTKDRDLNSASGRDKVVAVDVNEIPYLPGVQRVHGDFMLPKTTALIDAALLGKISPDFPLSPDNMRDVKMPLLPRTPLANVDVVLSDIVPTPSGEHAFDAWKSLEMCRRVWEFTKWRLKTASQIRRKEGGVLLLRHVPHPLLNRFRHSVLAPHFHRVYYLNPMDPHDIYRMSSPNKRTGSYFICYGFKGPGAGKRRVWM